MRGLELRTAALEGKPATISRKSVTANANASGLAVLGKETRDHFIREVADFLRQVGFSLRHFSFIPMVSVNAIECRTPLTEIQ